MDVSKKIVIGALIVLAVLSLWFGAVQPWRKARSYITAIHMLPTMNSFGDFEDAFNRSLSLSSTAGQEEIVKFLASDVVGDIITQEGIPEEMAATLVLFVESRFIEGDIFHSLAGGLLYSILWQNYHQEKYFEKSENYYQTLLALGSKLPPALYSLFDLYGSHGDVEKQRGVAEIILRHWPNEEMVKGVLQGS